MRDILYICSCEIDQKSMWQLGIERSHLGKGSNRRNSSMLLLILGSPRNFPLLWFQ